MGGLNKPSDNVEPVATKSLTEVMASLELPWPKDVFGEVPTDDWSDIDDWLRENKAYAIDTVSGTLMRRGWANYERLLRDAVNDLVEQGFVITTDVSNLPKGMNTSKSLNSILEKLVDDIHFPAKYSPTPPDYTDAVNEAKQAIVEAVEGIYGDSDGLREFAGLNLIKPVPKVPTKRKELL